MRNFVNNYCKQLFFNINILIIKFKKD